MWRVAESQRRNFISYLYLLAWGGVSPPDTRQYPPYPPWPALLATPLACSTRRWGVIACATRSPQAKRAPTNFVGATADGYQVGASDWVSLPAKTMPCPEWGLKTPGFPATGVSSPRARAGTYLDSYISPPRPCKIQSRPLELRWHEVASTRKVLRHSRSRIDC